MNLVSKLCKITTLLDYKIPFLVKRSVSNAVSTLTYATTLVTARKLNVSFYIKLI